MILAKQGGIVHIEGNPVYANGENLGELKVTITSYATDEDIRDMKVHRLDLTNFVYANKTLNLEQLKQAAKDAFVIEAIAQKKPSIKGEVDAAAKARKLAVSVNIESMDFDSAFLAYKLSGYVEYVPIFLRSASGDAESTIVKEIKKSKAILFVSGANSLNESFQVDVNKNGIEFSAKALKYIENKSTKNSLYMNLHTKLLIPKSFEDNTVNILANSVTNKKFGGNWQAIYNATVNGVKINKDETTEIEIINDGNLRYVNLNISIYFRAGYFNKSEFQNLLKNLKVLSYKIEDTNENLHGFIYKTDKIKDINKLQVSIISAQKVKRTHMQYNGNGFVFDKKSLKFIKSESNQNAIYINAHAKLLIPSEIKTNTVMIKANGLAAYKFGGNHQAIFKATINGIGINKDESTEVNVIHDGNLRYVNLNISMYCKKGYFDNSEFQELIRSVASLNYIVTDSEDAEKFYSFDIKNIKFTKNALLSVKVKKAKTKKFKINYNTNGLLIDKKSLKYIKSKSISNDVNMVASVKLVVPSNLNAKAITIKANSLTAYKFGGNHQAIFKATINDKQIKKGATKEISVKDNGKFKYVTLNIEMYCKKGYFDSSYFKELVQSVGNINYIATQDDEKWFILKAFKE